MSNSKRFQHRVTGDLPQTVTEDMIRQRAYEIYEARGREEGHDLEHWVEAEAEFLEESKHQAAA
jgi:hypothetical protein